MVQEVRAGDALLANRRLELLQDLPVLAVSREILKLAEDLITEGPIPRKAAGDAAHIAIATVYGCERSAEPVHAGRTDGRRAMKWKDEIVEEVRRAREAYAAQFDYDLARMFEDLKKKEEQNPAPRANLKPIQPDEQRL